MHSGPDARLLIQELHQRCDNIDRRIANTDNKQRDKQIEQALQTVARLEKSMFGTVEMQFAQKE